MTTPTLFATRDSKVKGVCEWCECEHDANKITLWGERPLKEKCGRFSGVGILPNNRGVLCESKARRWVGLQLKAVPIGGMIEVRFSCEIR